MKSKITTKKSIQSTRRQTPSGQSHSIPLWLTSATKLTLVLKSGVQVIPESQTETLQTKPRITTSRTTLRTYKGSNIPVKRQRALDI